MIILDCLMILNRYRPNDEMDIAVGRLLISSTEIAKEQVDKIEHYMKNGSAFILLKTRIVLQMMDQRRLVIGEQNMFRLQMMKRMVIS